MIISLLKISYFILGIVAIGLPITTQTHFALAFTMALFLLFSPREKIKAKTPLHIFSLGIIIILLCIRYSINDPVIQEGHNVYMPPDNSEKYPDYKQLPLEVQVFLQQKFEQTFPKKMWCSVSQLGCWRSYNRTELDWAFSMDSFWSKTTYSRNVHDISFFNSEEFSGGFLSNSKPNSPHAQLGSYDWWVTTPENPNRYNIPYFVMYVFPNEAEGGDLYWRGTLLIENEQGTYDTFRSNNMFDPNYLSKMSISKEHINRKIFGVSIESYSPSLGIKFKWPNNIRNLKLIINAIIFCISIFIFLLFPISMNSALNFSIAGLSILITNSLFDSMGIPYNKSWFAIDSLMLERSDGLTYKAFGRNILYFITHGQWREALRGSESVFYFMPGYRYFRAIEGVFFGDRDFGRFIYIFIFSISLIEIFRWFFTYKTTLCIWLSLMAGSIPFFLLRSNISINKFEFLNAIHWNLFEFISLARFGFAEVLGYALFLQSLIQSKKYIQRFSSFDQSLQFTFSINEMCTLFKVGILNALAIFVRPNIALASSLILFYLLILSQSKTNIRVTLRACISLLLGISPLSLITFHNWYFSKELVLLTNSTGIPSVLKLSPMTYLLGLQELFYGQFNTVYHREILSHLSLWCSPFQFLCLVIAAVTALTIQDKQSKYLAQLLCVAMLGLHIPLLFFTPNDRYAALAWILTTILNLLSIKRGYQTSTNLLTVRHKLALLTK